MLYKLHLFCNLFLDYYKFWLKSIDSYSDITTPVILVGTHAEEKSKEVSVKYSFISYDRTYFKCRPLDFDIFW